MPWSVSPLSSGSSRPSLRFSALQSKRPEWLCRIQCKKIKTDQITKLINGNGENIES